MLQGRSSADTKPTSARWYRGVLQCSTELQRRRHDTWGTHSRPGRNGSQRALALPVPGAALMMAGATSCAPCGRLLDASSSNVARSLMPGLETHSSRCMPSEKSGLICSV
eukprot:3896294-Prymnesium_polylepis.5